MFRRLVKKHAGWHDRVPENDERVLSHRSKDQKHLPREAKCFEGAHSRL